MNEQSASVLGVHWRHFLMVAIVAGSLALMLSQPPFAQDPTYHDFADRRTFFGIPNFFDVASNLPFLLVGIAGLRTCLGNGLDRSRNAWVALFAGVTLVGVGSAYYHWEPSNQTLLWDRLPITVGLMGLLAALLGEYIGERLGVLLLVPALILGVASVVYWHRFDDLRFYVWVQLIPLLTIPVAMALYRARYSHRWLLLVALGWYALAKLSEANDGQILAVSQGVISGHTLKHLLSALACFAVLLMLQRRKLLATKGT